MTLKNFLEQHAQTIKPLYTNICDSYRKASISGKQEDYEQSEKAQLILNGIYANAEDFAQIQQLAKEETNRSPLLRRQYDTVYRSYLSSQGDKALLEEMISLSTQIEQKFSTYRAIYNDKEYSDNDIENVLKKSTDNVELEGVWKAHKDIGPHVAADILQLVRIRNKHAQSLGFKDFHQMSLFLGEQEPAELDKFFDDLADKTNEVFAHHKMLLDQHLASRYGCKIEDLKPRHYQNRFFQEVPPSIGKIDLDGYYQNQNSEKLTKDFYTGIGLDISDILAQSDLYEKPQKNQHAYCITDKFTIRVLCNIKPTQKWMNTMLHEFGHAAYDKYISKDIPYLLRSPAHTFTTEAVAEFFQDLSVNGNWMQDMLNISEEDKTKIQNSSSYLLAFDKLIFAQWAQVIRRFEKSLYENPEQDLNKLWRDLVSKYQGITPPAGRNSPDRATKIHIATAPCYYHNYLLGYVLAEQRRKKMEEISPEKSSLVGQKQVGQRFIDNVFALGLSITWRELVQKSTGQDLNSEFFVQSIKEKLSSNI